MLPEEKELGIGAPARLPLSSHRCRSRSQDCGVVTRGSLRGLETVQVACSCRQRVQHTEETLGSLPDGPPTIGPHSAASAMSAVDPGDADLGQPLGHGAWAPGASCCAGPDLHANVHLPSH